MTMGDRNPLGQRNRCVLRDGVVKRAELRQEPRGRSRVEQVALASVGHVRDDRAGRVEMGEHVDTEHRLEIGDGGLESPESHVAGVGHEQPDRTDIASGGVR